MKYTYQSGNFIRLEGGTWGGLYHRPVRVGDTVELVRRDGECVDVRVLEILPQRHGLHCFRVAKRDLAVALDMIAHQNEKLESLTRRVEALTELLWSRP